MRVLLEVGHFHSVGVHFRDAHALYGDRAALVHIKDQKGEQSVPFGAGEIDLPGLFELLAASGYHGKFVVEMEVADPANTQRYLAEAFSYLDRCAR
jgi:sugar phosphate isomerase/epimerase